MGEWIELDAEKKQKLSEALRKIDFLACLTPEQINTLLNGSLLRDFKTGEVIIFKGEVSNSMYIIGSGKAIVCLQEPKNIGSSDYFGEMSFFLNRPVTSSVKASDEGVRVLSVPGKLLKEMVDKNPDAHKLVNDKMFARGIPEQKKKKT